MTRVKTGPKQGFKEKKPKIPVNSWEGVIAASDKKYGIKFEKHSFDCTVRYHFVIGTWTPAFTYSSVAHNQLEPQERELEDKENIDVEVVTERINSLSLED